MRHFPLLVAALLVALSVVACSSPGGGGSGFGVCLTNPAFPGCADLLAGMADAAGGELPGLPTVDTAVGTDDAGPTPDGATTSDPDVGGTQTDTAPADGTATGCGAVGALRCNGNMVEQCGGVDWSFVADCGVATCQQGKCVADVCTPQCGGAQCGSDGCGGNCGTCPSGQACDSGVCIGGCEPSCVGKQCGSDGCGGTCGFCGEGQVCEGGICAVDSECSCSGKECGDDGCGGTCGACPSGWSCAEGMCEQVTCTPSCVGKACGSDGCGGQCGFCVGGESCSEGQCVSACVPNCAGKQCGSDGCTGTCGTCSAGQACVSGFCQSTTGDGLSCTELLDCIVDCPEGDATCQNACFAAASDVGSSELLAYDDCLVGAASVDALYIAQNCAGEASACFYDASGTSGCAAIFDCFQVCGAGDNACIDSCISGATATAQAQLTALDFCLSHYCSDPAAPADCGQTAVADQSQCAQFANTCFSN